MVSLLIGTLEFAKVLITIFIMFYAYFFLTRTEKYEERRPWVFLFIGSMFLFVSQVITALQMFRGLVFDTILVTSLLKFVEFGFLTFFLFCFLYQHHMLRKRGVILLEEKSQKRVRGEDDPWNVITEKYTELEKKLLGEEKEESEDPEEEMLEEMDGMEDDEELKKEEDEIEHIVEEQKND